MLRAIAVTLVAIAGLASPVSAQNTPLFIQHVAVVDVSAGRVLSDMTVEIRGRTIAAVDSAPRIRVTHGARIVDGRGKYLIPGLWDMHVHLSFPEGAAQIFLPLMVANGVLGARDMHSVLAPIISLKRAVASGAQIGPRLFVELGLLVRSGLTPAEALRTSTVNPAIFLGLTDSLGTVARGKVADLVLLDANSLTDIANTKRIGAVIQGGRVLDRKALDEMLANAKSRASASGN
jgi:imidazolonepropionase-like amidohydrolase